MLAIEATEISKVIHQHTILHDVSLCIEQGAHVGIIGRNGSGKSVLFKLLTGLMLPSRGTVRVWNQEVNAKHFPDSVGCLIEQPGVLRNRSGIENLLYLAAIQGKVSETEIKALMERLDLDPNNRKPAKTYSLGMKQKLGIIQAIMEKPKLLILDEPFNNLDNKSISTVYEIVRECQDQGVTTILSSHHQEDIDMLCEQTYTMVEGTLSPN